MQDEDHDHDQGLAHDLRTLAERRDGRRRVLRLIAGASVFALLSSCGSDGSGAGSDAGDGDSGDGDGDGDSSGSCETIPSETAGPYPGNGTNGANALALAGIVRSDIRQSVGDASAVAEGVALTVTLQLVGTNTSCAPLEGYAIYLWHCDRDGNYSMYADAVKDENYLRGVQETDGDGKVTFTTVFPGCYSGRWPHMHLQIYASLDAASNGANAVHTSQLALPEASCAEAYEVAGYEASVTNLARVSLESDNVFSDGVTLELAEVSGSAAAGFAATLRVAVPV